MHVSKLSLSEKNIFFVFLNKLSELSCMCFHCFLLCRGGSMRENACRRLGRFREGLRVPQHPSREFHSVWLSRNLIRELLQEVCRCSIGCSVIFYKMFRNGILEDGWREKDEGVGMEVGQGFEVVQGLVDGVERRCRWMNLFKEG